MNNQQTTAPTSRLDRAFTSTRAVLAAVRPEQLDVPTPCASWDVRELINHFIGTAHWAAAVMSDNDVTDQRDFTAGDYLATYDTYIRDALAAFETPGALDKTVRLSFTEMSGAAFMGLAAVDQFTHGWDLARAIGRATDLDPELAEELLIQTKATVADALRGPDGAAPFGPVAEAPADAVPADRLAAFLGRTS